MKKLSVPDYLSLLRIALTFVIFIFIIFFKMFNHPLILFLAMSLFIIATVTDYFDGYLSRKYGLSSTYGTFLDYIADKFLINLTFLGLVYIDKIHFFIPVIFLMRDYFILIVRLFFKEYYEGIKEKNLNIFNINFRVAGFLKYIAIATIMYPYDSLFFIPGWLLSLCGYSVFLTSLVVTLKLTYDETVLIFQKAFKEE